MPLNIAMTGTGGQCVLSALVGTRAVRWTCGGRALLHGARSLRRSGTAAKIGRQERESRSQGRVDQSKGSWRCEYHIMPRAGW